MLGAMRGGPTALEVAVGWVVGPMLALYLGLSRHAPHERARAALGLGRPERRAAPAIVCAVIAGAALAPVAAEVAVRLHGLWPLPEPSAEERLAMEAAMKPGPRLWAAYVLITTAAPLAQELLYRGFLLPRLAGGLVVTAALYTISQVQPHEMPGALLLAFGLGVVALAARSVWAALLGRLAYEGVPLALGALGVPLHGALVDEPVLMPPALLGACAGLAAVAVWTAWRTRVTS
jgi:hypothetical protein